MRIRTLATLSSTVVALAGVGWWLLEVSGKSPTAPTAAPPPPGRPRLVRVAGGSVRRGLPASRGIEDEVVLPAGRLAVGRAAQSHVRLHEATVSLKHAELEVTSEGHVRVRDLGSENGVRVDGVPVADKELHDGNRLELGDVVMVFKTDLALGSSGRQGGEWG